jgi:hypothetical protein
VDYRLARSIAFSPPPTNAYPQVKKKVFIGKRLQQVPQRPVNYPPMKSNYRNDVQHALKPY